MNVRSQVPTMNTKTTTINQYITTVADQYRRGCQLSDLTCKRLARIALCREVSKALSVRFTYRQACSLLV
jgi:4-hydroxy-3-methylbut-2-en-1-yl diphosphate synthase IspG/GcpE